jgi:ribosomal protein L37AE/L43A
VCIRRPRRCSACGQDRIISTVDREGQSRCKQCPDRDGRDPLAVLAATVTAVDPSLAAEMISAAARRVFSKPARLQKLAWAVEGDPGVLTGGGARAPIGGVLRLIGELCDAGAQAVTRPACPRCQRVVRLYRRIGGLWCCRTCVAKTRAQPCAKPPPGMSTAGRFARTA